jgi:valyl-tRNA synthetase
MDIPSKYDPSQVESQWYDYWMQHHMFRSVPDEREPYTILIPPPNVTGVLHMGHMLNNTLQDVLIRRARLKGLNACWVPGTDHASIATEAKVVAHLKSQGIEKSTLSREEFLKHAWAWTDEYGGVILKQLKKLGCSCDWERTKFTLDDDMSASVIKMFVDLFEKGLIYRGYRMVNWDPEAQTTLSDEEVIYEERNGKLYYVAYDVVDSDEKLTIATTRPETLLGDTAICIHPEDQRYKHLHGKKAIVPIAGREIPIITDSYVDLEFGTGCLKVTPAHDINDKELGEKHQLDFIDIFHPDATLNHHGLHYEGQDRFAVRKAIAKELEEKDQLVKTEDYTNNVGTSERTKAVIEPRLSEQWFLKMEDLAEPALKAVLETEEVRLFPKKFENTYRHWMENIRDWNISRQLWWGQQIPAYYYGEGSNDFVVAETPEKALEVAKSQSGKDLTAADLRQDPDVLDTWFSSWLWPISVFGGVLEPENEEVQYYYPSSDLVTGPDILFFWVARMIISGYELRDQPPFRNVYLTGLVRDEKGRKMSKQLGNSPDALKLIQEYGADGVRVGLLLSSAAGNDLLFDQNLCQQGKNFANKIWNAFRLVKSWEVADIDQPESARLGIEWYRQRFQEVLGQIEDHYSKYRISDALMATYKLIWDDFCSWFLELVKPAYQSPVDQETLKEVLSIFDQNLRILHPFMPFLTEEIWQRLEDRAEGESLCLQSWPQVEDSLNSEVLQNFAHFTEVIAGIRTIRKDKQIAQKEALKLVAPTSDPAVQYYQSLVSKLGNMEEILFSEEQPEGSVGFRVGALEYFVPVSGRIDLEAEKQKILEELNYTKGFLASVQKKLSNQRFVQNAPEKVVEIEKKKASDAEAKIETLEKSLEQLG